MWALVLTKEWHSAGLALAVLMLCIFDAMGLRREIGRQAAAVNQLTGAQLREIMGHDFWEVVGGIILGFAVAATYWSCGVIR
jgi:acid phosphatase family membrane protein YuiD